MTSLAESAEKVEIWLNCCAYKGPAQVHLANVERLRQGGDTELGGAVRDEHQSEGRRRPGERFIPP